MNDNKEVLMDSMINQELLLKIVSPVDIKELNFSIRTDRLLRGVGIDTIGKLCSKTKLDLLEEESLLYHTIREAEKRLRQIGLNLKPIEFPIATRNDWKRLPVSDVSISFDIELQLQEDQYFRLKRGYVPHNMDEWFIYFEKGELHLYRSSGFCLFSVELNKFSHKHHVKTYVYNIDTIKQWKADAPEMIKKVLEKYARY